MVGQSVDNNRIKQSIRKILLASIELKMAKTTEMPNELRPTVKEVRSLWEATRREAAYHHHSLLERVNGSHFRP
jgi:hypothetical protein